MPLFYPPAQIGISSDGNTGGTTGFNSDQQFVGTNLITLSQSTAAGGNTITIDGPRVPTMQRFDNQPDVASASNAGLHATVALVNGSMWLFPLTPGNDVFPGNMSALTMFMDMSGSSFTSASGAQTLRASVGIYTLAGASSLSLINSGSASITQNAATANTSLWHGARWFTWVSSQFSTSLTFSQTSYWLGVIMSTSAVSQSLSHIGFYQGASEGTAHRSGTMGASGATAASRGWTPWAGIVATNAIPASIHITGITKTGASGGFVNHVVMEALHSAW